MLRSDFVSQLEAELENSVKQRDAAKAMRLRAEVQEAKWERDVRALTSLIASRREESEGNTVEIQASAAEYSTDDDPTFVSPHEEVNRVDWAFKQIAKAGAAGMLPNEIYEEAKNQGLSMHPNYPYTATSKLLERGRIEKVGKRYRAVDEEAPPTETELALAKAGMLPTPLNVDATTFSYLWKQIAQVMKSTPAFTIAQAGVAVEQAIGRSLGHTRSQQVRNSLIRHPGTFRRNDADGTWTVIGEETN